MTILYLIGAIVGCFILTYVMNEDCDHIGGVLDEIANRTRMSQSLKGGVLSAFASSCPELVNVMLAVFLFNSFVDVGVGTIAGSALVNAVLGSGLVLVACLKGKDTIQLPKEQVKRDVYSYLLLLAVFLGAIYVGVPSRILGLVLVLCYVGYVYYAFKTDKTTEPEIVETGLEDKSTMYLTVKFIIGIAILIFCCNYMVVFAGHIGTFFGVPMLIMSLIVLAASTSVPDVSLSIRDGKNGFIDAGLASCVSSNFFDIAFSLGAALLITGVQITLDNVAMYTMGAVVFCMLMVAKFYSGKMGRMHGFIMIGTYVAFIISLFVLFV